MATLIIPDSHERLDRLESALKGRLEQADHVIHLGDHFDTFASWDEKRVRDVCRFILMNIDGFFYEPEDPDVPGLLIPTTFLLGNHDCHLFFQHNAFKCSGYNTRTQAIVDEMIPEDVRRKFKLFTRVGPYLVSHAGFHEATLQYATEEVEREALNAAFSGKMDPLFGAGYARGGWQKIGGCTWLDWNQEFTGIYGTPQIVGHTQGNTVRTKTADDQTVSYCIDTALRHVCWVRDDGTVTIEAV